MIKAGTGEMVPTKVQSSVIPVPKKTGTRFPGKHEERIPV